MIQLYWGIVVLIAVVPVHDAVVSTSEHRQVESLESVEDLTRICNNYIQTVDPRLIGFWLYTRKNGGKECKVIPNNQQSLCNCGFNRKFATKILIHGYRNSRSSESVASPKDAYLTYGEYNVIIVDWQAYTQSSYGHAVCVTNSTAWQTFRFIKFLCESGFVDVRTLHCVGHSLGAHVCGFVGLNLKGSLGRITGLDPAGPMYSNGKPERRLDITHAHYVDIIHTSRSYIGISHSIGHADFWPNGGSHQPRCTFDFFGLCSHAEAFRYWAESILNRDRFPCKKCISDVEAKSGSCSGLTNAVMGEDAVLRYPTEGLHLGYILWIWIIFSCIIC